ncbi:Doubled CXXCH motif [Planctomycetes bacterium Pan216]|uniref:Doubled CXXCH motif n=1 Tax=Kolteria novifilia TaxID=2527975 RepID=A0A518AZI5_9BACT|nr:Doubled CXXCH motif [Planctomycetes bacterium Pan216]
MANLFAASPRHGRLPFGVVVGLATLAVVMLVGVVILWPMDGPGRTQANRDERRSSTHLSIEDFAGDASCKACHAREFEAHRQSGHASTLLPMPASDLAQRLSGNAVRDPQRGYAYDFTLVDGTFTVTIPEFFGAEGLAVDWLLGSGIHAQTPVSLSRQFGTGLEHRMTWYAESDAMGVTPGQQLYRSEDVSQPAEYFGRVFTWKEMCDCLGCHATFLPEDRELTPETIIANIGCERCHGPSRAHVDAARRGKAFEAPTPIRFPDAETLVDGCAECHRGEKDVLGDAAALKNVRFQPFGLKRSECFQKTPGGISCSACHDPHGPVSTDRVVYNRVCMNCHEPDTTKGCPKVPVGDCVSCHLPPVEIHPGLTFHDHWIRVRNDETDAKTIK